MTTSIKTLRLAIVRSVPPLRMPGYWRCWRTWQIIARCLGVSRRHDQALLGEYQSAANRASTAGEHRGRATA